MNVCKFRVNLDLAIHGDYPTWAASLASVWPNL